ncbi:MAG: Kelch repeat-containing protein [Myxococcaceae bacterium]
MSPRALTFSLCALVGVACAPPSDASSSPVLTQQRGLTAMLTARSSHAATQMSQGTVLFVSGTGLTAELFNPDTGEFSPAAPMKAQHPGLTATLLRNGEVLVVGGASAERYDPVSNTWLSAGDLPNALSLSGHTATLLQDGRVLLAGAGKAVLYSPAGPKWTVLPAPASRTGHTATLLTNGKVLVTGGGVASAELFDPGSQTWGSPSALVLARTGHTATLLPSGEVVVVGGGAPTDESYNPDSNSWKALFSSSSSGGRSFHTTTLLPNGSLVTLGGYVNGAAVATAEGSGIALATASGQHTATLLRSGKVLIAGGQSAPNGATLNRTELLAPLAPGTWTKTTGDMRVPRLWHKSTVLRDGRVLIVGGFLGAATYNDSQVFNPATGTFGPPATLPGSARDSFTLTTLQDGRVLAVGGIIGDAPVLDDASIYNPATNTWVATTRLPTVRTEHVAVLLGNGKVLVAGGSLDDNGNDSLAAYLYTPAENPSNGSWATAGNTLGGHTAGSAVLLQDGTVLVAGGENSTTGEIYNPVANNWVAAGTFTTARRDHMLTLLPNGKVLLAGGEGNGVVATCFLFDPGMKSWIPTTSLGTARTAAVQTLLPSGRVLIAGGRSTTNAAGTLSSTELYDPLLGTWSAGPSMGTARGWQATVDVLPSGKVLVTGGETLGATGLATAEVFDEGLSGAAFAPALADPLPAVVAGSSAWTVTGARFTGIAGEDAPVFTLNRLSEGTDGTTSVTALRALTWTATQARLTVPATLSAGRYWLRVSVRGVNGEAKPVVVAAATHPVLSISSPPRLFGANVCGRERAAITVAGPAGAAFTAVSSASTGAWFKDPACAEQSTTFTVGPNGSVNLFYKDSAAGSPRLGVNSLTGFGDPPSQSHVVDGTAPTMGTVTAKVTETELVASWSGFFDPETGVRFDWALGSAQGLSELQSSTSAGTANTVRFTGLKLASDTSPYFSLQVTNGAGMPLLVNLGPLTLGKEESTKEEGGCTAGPGGRAGMFAGVLWVLAWLRATRRSPERKRVRIR